MKVSQFMFSIIGLSALSSCNLENSEASKESIVQEQKREAERAQLELDSLRIVTSVDLAQAYAENSIAADKIYKGKRFKITGAITNINTDMIGNGYITMAGTNEFVEPQFSFDDEAKDQLAALRKGEIITLACTGRGDVMKIPMSRSCQIIPTNVEVSTRSVQSKTEEIPKDSKSGFNIPGVSDETALKLVSDDANIYRCGDRYFNTSTIHIAEYRDPVFYFASTELSKVDSLNGISWAGTAYFRVAVIRYWEDGQWSDWLGYSPVAPIGMYVVRNGNLQETHSGYVEQKKPFSCSSIPGEQQSQLINVEDNSARVSATPESKSMSVSVLNIGSSVASDHSILYKTKRFKPSDTIYASVVTKGHPAKVTAVWTYQDGQTVNKDELQIDGGEQTTAFHISNQSVWPSGRYKVEIFVDEVSSASSDLEVE